MRPGLARGRKGSFLLRPVGASGPRRSGGPPPPARPRESPPQARFRPRRRSGSRVVASSGAPYARGAGLRRSGRGGA
ncbi:MAG: hypothetical protein E6I11_16115 [Chloroflexi bacterium]|nr:MAG: hypothetical protein E6I11_16115 [Chloroflexota bacterium]